MAEGGEQDKESKTEDPTSKRLQEARDKGQVATSREVGNALAILAGTIAIVVMGAGVSSQLMTTMRGFIERPESFPLGTEETFSLFWATSVEIAETSLAASPSRMSDRATRCGRGRPKS